MWIRKAAGAKVSWRVLTSDNFRSSADGCHKREMRGEPSSWSRRTEGQVEKCIDWKSLHLSILYSCHSCQSRHQVVNRPQCLETFNAFRFARFLRAHRKMCLIMVWLLFVALICLTVVLGSVNSEGMEGGVSAGPGTPRMGG